MRLKGCHGYNKVIMYADVSEDISTADLLDLIAEATTVPVNCLELRGGYPVKPIDIPDDGSIRATDGLGISPNDVLIVQSSPAAGSAVPAVSAEKPQSAPAIVGNVDTTMVCSFC